MTTIGTKNGSVIVKDGSVAENCNCCTKWLCMCDCAAGPGYPRFIKVSISNAPLYASQGYTGPNSLNGDYQTENVNFSEGWSDSDGNVCCVYTVSVLLFSVPLAMFTQVQLKGNKLFVQHVFPALYVLNGQLGGSIPDGAVATYTSPNIGINDAACLGQFPGGAKILVGSATATVDYRGYTPYSPISPFSFEYAITLP